MRSRGAHPLVDVVYPLLHALAHFVTIALEVLAGDWQQQPGMLTLVRASIKAKQRRDYRQADAAENWVCWQLMFPLRCQRLLVYRQ